MVRSPSDAMIRCASVLDRAIEDRHVRARALLGDGGDRIAADDATSYDRSPSSTRMRCSRVAVMRRPAPAICSRPARNLRDHGGRRPRGIDDDLRLA